MGVVIATTIGLVLFSLMERRSPKYLSTLGGCTVALLLGSMFTIRIPDDCCRGLLLGASFALCALLPRLIVPCHPLEAGGDEVTRPEHVVPLGIIDFCWVLIMAACLACVGFMQRISPVMLPADWRSSSLEYRTRLLDFTTMLFEKVIDSVFLVGGVLAGCMAILWAGEIWRKRKNSDRRWYKRTTIAAIRMAIAFFTVAYILLVHIAVPLYRSMLALLESIK
jgi:hypothetical protein